MRKPRSRQPFAATLPDRNPTEAKARVDSDDSMLPPSQQPLIFGPSPYFGPNIHVTPTPEPPSSLFRPWGGPGSRHRISQAVGPPKETTHPVLNDDDAVFSSFRRPAPMLTLSGDGGNSAEGEMRPSSTPTSSFDPVAAPYYVSRFLMSAPTPASSSTPPSSSSIWRELSFKETSSPASLVSYTFFEPTSTAASDMSLDPVDPAQPNNTNNAITLSVERQNAHSHLASDHPVPSEAGRVQLRTFSEDVRGSTGKSLYEISRGSSSIGTPGKSVGLSGRQNARPAPGQTAWRQHLPFHSAGLRTGARLRIHRERWVLVYERYLSRIRQRRQADITQNSQYSLSIPQDDDCELYLELYGTPAASSYDTLPPAGEDAAACRAASPPGETSDNSSPPTEPDMHHSVIPPALSESVSEEQSVGVKTGRKRTRRKRSKVKTKATASPRASSKVQINKRSSANRSYNLRGRLPASGGSIVGDARRRMIAHHLGLSHGTRRDTTYSQQASLQGLHAENTAQKALIDRQADTIRRLMNLSL